MLPKICIVIFWKFSANLTLHTFCIFSINIIFCHLLLYLVEELGKVAMAMNVLFIELETNFCEGFTITDYITTTALTRSK